MTMEPLDMNDMTDAEWRAYRSGRKERGLAMDGAMANEPVQSSDFIVTGYDPCMVPSDGFEDGVFEGGEKDEVQPHLPFIGDELQHVPPPQPSRLEQALKLNMMTASERLKDTYGSRALPEAAPKVAEGMSKDGTDMVNLPPHYARFKIEPIRFIGENKLDWFQGNIVKYSLRWDAKNGVQDIDKVIRTAQMYRRYILGDPDWWMAGKPEDFKV